MGGDQIISIGRFRVRCGGGVRIRQSTARAIQNIRISLLFYRSCGTLMSHRDHSVQRCFKSNTSIVYRSTYGKRAGGGLSPFRTTRAQRGASADVKEKNDFHSNKPT